MTQSISTAEFCYKTYQHNFFFEQLYIGSNAFFIISFYLYTVGFYTYSISSRGLGSNFIRKPPNSLFWTRYRSSTACKSLSYIGPLKNHNESGALWMSHWEQNWPGRENWWRTSPLSLFHCRRQLAHENFLNQIQLSKFRKITNI